MAHSILLQLIRLDPQDEETFLPGRELPTRSVGTLLKRVCHIAIVWITGGHAVIHNWFISGLLQLDIYR